uniref:C-type lectin domain-containing protein n=1 Tax=Daphnia galeata TaxID=27404 RepID=A0A8J2RRH4_9CRUS|nr:unnamed protein product [Daphnia galeata]
MLIFTGLLSNRSLKSTLLVLISIALLSIENGTDGFSSKSPKSCPEYFQNDVRVPCYFLGEKCYCFSTEMFIMTWNDARYYCRLSNSNYTLISLETKTEDDLIHQHINATEGSYSEDQWNWSTSPLPGEPFNYSNWASTRPLYNLNGWLVELTTAGTATLGPETT